ncbi:sugar-binding transcriptional regulator [Actinophytocola sp. NPDC049390]|uniref:sugar-binding transcriptional regulator n=1 Tax=Actinophytocola sp. NPDC049390 TaxID=3363894 RepID=UPI00378AF452
MQILDVARRYYEDGMSQAEIAAAIGYSRPTVGRMLADARRSGVVRIQIAHPLERAFDLERVISTRFGIANVRVTGTAPATDNGTAEVGAAAAAILGRIVRPGMVIGLSNGRVHGAVLQRLSPVAVPDVTFVQMVGGLSEENPLVDGPELCRGFASAFDGVAHTLHAPLIVGSPRDAAALMSSPEVASTLRRAAAADLAVVGIGAGFRHATGVFDHYLTKSDMRALRAQGAVGHVLGQFLDHDGQVLDHPARDLVVGLRLEHLRNIPHVIGIAAGREKGEAIAAALRGGLVNALIVDRETAQALAYLDGRR